MDPKDTGNSPSGKKAEKGVQYGEQSGSVVDIFSVYRGGASGKVSPASATLSAAQTDVRLPPGLGDLPSRSLGDVPQPDLSKAVSLSMGLYMGEPDAKVMGNELGQLGAPAGDTDFRLLEESIASLQAQSSQQEETGRTLGIGGKPEHPAMVKGGLSMETENMSLRGQTSSDSNGGHLKLFSDDQSTFDILQDFELVPDSPSGDLRRSPWEVDPLFEDESNGLLSPLEADDPFMMAASEDRKPLLLLDCKPQLSEQQRGLPLPSMPLRLPQVKTEKEDYIELITPGVVKQEKKGPTYCGAPFSGSHVHLSGISVHGVSTSGGQMYHYDLNTSPQQPDQKPVFNVMPTLPSIAEAWKRCHSTGEDSLSSLGSVTYTSRPSFSNGYSRFVFPRG